MFSTYFADIFLPFVVLREQNSPTNVKMSF